MATNQIGKSTSDAKKEHGCLSRNIDAFDDWRAALRVLGALAADSNVTIENEVPCHSSKDILTFSGFVDAYLLAPRATFGTLMATCSKAFEKEKPFDWQATTMPNTTTLRFDSVIGQDKRERERERDTPEVEAQVFQLNEQLLRSLGAPPLLVEDFMKRFGGGNQTDEDDDSYLTSGGENIVWILAGHIGGNEPVRYVEEAMRSRMRLYPKSRIILVDNDSPPTEAEKLRTLVDSKISGDHSYVRNPPPSYYEQGAYHSGIKRLMSLVPDPSESEIVVFSQATNVLLRPLPLKDTFQQGCDIRPVYPQCCGALATPPCNESAQRDWISEVGPIDSTCQDDCPDGECAMEYANAFGAYKDRICDQEPVMGIMHAGMITTGSLARNVLYGGFSFQRSCKMIEQISGYWILAGRTQPGTSCTESIDSEVELMGNVFNTNYFMFKFHGATEGWGQGLYFRFLEWLQTLDTNSDGEVTFGEMMSNESHWKQSTQEFCTSAFVNERNGNVLKRYVQLVAEWYDWCSISHANLTEDENFVPTMCKAAQARGRSMLSTTKYDNNTAATLLLDSLYNRWSRS